jgi:transglutaminase-like putative cysteine protease
MRLTTECELLFEAGGSTPVIFMLRPRSGHGQWVVQEEYLLEPCIPVVEYTDSYGNLCQRMVVQPGVFKIRTQAIIEAADQIDVEPMAQFVPVQYLPDQAIQFLLPSRYCQSDLLGNLALEIVGSATTGYEQVEAIRSWIQQHIKYEYGTSNASTSAVDTAESKVGVCRDFAHLGISLCRSLNIPARMVVGYLHQLEPMDLHAWFEAYLGEAGSPTIAGRWYTFDATQKTAKGNRVAIAYGRDATDVAISTQFGEMTLLEMQVKVGEANGERQEEIMKTDRQAERL